MSGGVELEGLAEATFKLKELESKVSKRIVRRAMKAGGKIIQSAAISAAPSESGNLRSKIKLKMSSRKGQITATVGFNRKDSPATWYAPFVLFGHKVGSRKLGSRRHQVAANDFLGKALEQKHEQAEEAIRATIYIGVEEAA